MHRVAEGGLYCESFIFFSFLLKGTRLEKTVNGALKGEVPLSAAALVQVPFPWACTFDETP